MPISKTIIACSLKEQLYRYHKRAFMLNYCVYSCRVDKQDRKGDIM